MSGRTALPADWHVENGNPNRLTKNQLKKRKANEIKIGNQNFKLPILIKDDKIASKKWNEIMKLYKESNTKFVSTGDIGLIERYCLTYSEYVDLQKMKKSIMKGKKTLKDKFSKLADSGILRFIEKKLDTLLKMENGLFLTPLSKLKNVTRKTEDSPIDPLKDAGFGNV